MTAQHTPEPWMLDDIRPDDNIAVLYDDRAGDNVTPTIALVLIDNTTMEQAIADARLIVAAPRMLTLLEECEQEMRGWTFTGAGGRTEHSERLARIRAAIAAARGATP